MRIFPLHLAALFLLMTPLKSAPSNPLNSFRWDYRIILVSTTSDNLDGLVVKLESAKAAISERDILWFVMDEDSVVTNYSESLAKDFPQTIAKRYFVDQKTQVRLIGKDGGVKEKAAELDLDRLFKLIDAMPSSLTKNSTASSRNSNPNSIVPLWENFRALPSKLTRICWILRGSE